MVRRHANQHPRHLQKELGPSQIGHPCGRNVVGQMLLGAVAFGASEINPPGDPLPSYIGVASHAALEEAARQANRQMEERGATPRWISERKVKVREGLSGTCDLYDNYSDTVIDYKFPGTTRMTYYRKGDPGPIYRAQAHLYGRGYRNAGKPVKRVGIWFLPRAGQLNTSYLWTEDYNDELVDEILARMDQLILLMDELDLEHHPERLALIPITPHECQWCPFWTANPAHPNPIACMGGEEYLPKITAHSGMTVPTKEIG